MKHSHGPKVILASLLALTLAIKLTLGWQPGPVDPDITAERISVFFVQHGFESRLEKKFGGVLVHANAGSCHMVIREAAPQGWNRALIEWRAKPVGRLTYVFDGALYTHQPFLAPVLDEYWTRVRFKLGLSPNRRPILAVAASDDCTVDELPWSELGVLS